MNCTHLAVYKQSRLLKTLQLNEEVFYININILFNNYYCNATDSENLVMVIVFSILSLVYIQDIIYSITSPDDRYEAREQKTFCEDGG